MKYPTKFVGTRVARRVYDPATDDVHLEPIETFFNHGDEQPQPRGKDQSDQRADQLDAAKWSEGNE